MQEQSAFKKPVNKKALIIGIAAIVIFIVILASNGDGGSSNQPAATTSNPITNTNLTPEQALEEQLKSTVKRTGVTNFTYKGIELTDSDKKDGSKMVTVKVRAESIYNRDSFIRNTGELGSNIFEQAFKTALPISDVIVWYYGDTKDQYGNAQEDIIMSYAMTKAVTQKINWSGFNKNQLCDFLRTEGKNDPENVCVVKVNIQ